MFHRRFSLSTEALILSSDTVGWSLVKINWIKCSEIPGHDRSAKSKAFLSSSMVAVAADPTTGADGF